MMLTRTPKQEFTSMSKTDKFEVIKKARNFIAEKHDLKKDAKAEELVASLDRSLALFKRLEMERGMLLTKANKFEEEILRLKEVKEPFYDLFELMGTEVLPDGQEKKGYPKSYITLDSEIKPGHTVVMVKDLTTTGAKAKILVTSTLYNDGFGLIIGGKQIKNIHGMLVRFPLNHSFVVKSVWRTIGEAILSIFRKPKMKATPQEPERKI